MRNYKFVVTLAATIIGLFLLQAFPLTGVFLMLLGTGLWTGCLVHVLILSLPSLGASRRMVCFLSLIPICLYGLYYFALFTQAKLIEKYKAEVAVADVGKVFDFDPQRQSLVVTFSDRNAVDRYDVPAIYHKRDRTISGYTATFLAPVDQCSGLHGENCAYAAGTWRPANADVCRIYVDHAPSLKQVTLSENERRRVGIDFSTSGEHRLTSRSTGRRWDR